MTTYFEHLEDKFRFGKFKGCCLGEVLQFNPEYLIWVVKNVEGTMCVIDDSAIQEIEKIFPGFIVTSEFESYRKRRIIEHKSKVYFQEKEYHNNYYDESPTYERYNGSYAQDEMGYSDDDIDTIFDGDPSAYWNID